MDFETLPPEVETDTAPIDVGIDYPVNLSALGALFGPDEPPQYSEVGATEIGFIPAADSIVAYFEPVTRTTEAGLDLSMVDSIDASLPRRGRIVAVGPYVPYDYQIGTEILAKRYVGIQMEVDGDTNYWYFSLLGNEVMGRFLTSTDPIETD